MNCSGPAMPHSVAGTLDGALPSASDQSSRSGADTPHRRTASLASVCRHPGTPRHTQSRRLCGRPQAWCDADGEDGHRGAVQEAQHQRRYPKHPVSPYLLRRLPIERPNHVGAADITYIPMQHGFVYLFAVLDWASRRVLSWRLCRSRWRRTYASKP